MDQSVMDDSVKTTLEKQKPIVKKYLEGAAANAAAATYSYDCTVSLASAAGGYLNVDFKKNGSRFARGAAWRSAGRSEAQRTRAGRRRTMIVG